MATQSALTKTLRLALIQLKVSTEKSTTFGKVKDLVSKAVSNKADVVCLPECFNSPYGVQYFAACAEQIPGKTSQILSELAKENKIYIIGGSIPEKESEKLYNTCLVYGPDGLEVAKHRKVHLFDVNVPGGIKFTESDVLSAGNKLTMFNIGPWKVGLGICYDIRFAEMSREYEKQGCHLLVYPGAFNMTTGPKHWELLIRARSVDHQLYVACCSPARDESATYVAWGHSTICDPWADVIARAGESEEIVYAVLDLENINAARNAIPTRTQKRFDVY